MAERRDRYIASDDYPRANPRKVHVYRSTISHQSRRGGSWVVYRGYRFLGRYPTHAQALRRALMEAGCA